MKKSTTILLLLWLSVKLCTGNSRADLAVSLIPDSLLVNANSVIRNSETTLNITSPGEAEVTYHKVVTIMNEKASDELQLAIYYNTFKTIRGVAITIYDKKGIQMNKHTKNDMHDLAATDGFSLYIDDRLKYLRVGGGDYPVTVEYTYAYQYYGLLDYPDWQIQGDQQSVESASLMVTVPAVQDINYKEFNINLTPEKITDTNELVYTWTVSGRKAVRMPENTYSYDYYIPHVRLSPRQFEIAEYKGSLNTWREFGTTMYDAYKSKRTLNEKEKKEIRAMVKDAHTDREKAEILYSYLQQNFRYVSIDIGTGGYIPFSADIVHSTKYGDCKALSNYMCAILDVVGITSYPTLINAGPAVHPIDTTFPSSKFNHCILVAEIDHKPIWLECTSSALPFGELGTFTENRYGLMLTEAGGRITSTPKSDAALNTISISHQVRIKDNTAADISGTVNVRGEYSGLAKQYLLMGTKKDQENYLYKALNLKQYGNVEVLTPTDSAAVISAALHGDMENIYDFRTAGKAFLPSTFIKQWHENITVDSINKGHSFISDCPGKKQEVLTYLLPDSSSISLPADYDLDNDLIYFHRRCMKADNNKATIETTFIQKKYIVPSKEVALLKESMQKVNKYLQQKVIVGASPQTSKGGLSTTPRTQE